MRAIAPPRPKFIAVGGLSGTGKIKARARMLAPLSRPMPGAVILRSDVERKVLFGVGETEKLPADAIRDEVNARVYATLADKARRIFAAGHSVIVDAVFAQAAGASRASPKRQNPPNLTLRGLFLTADLETRLGRVGARARDASDADAGVAQAQEHTTLARSTGRPSTPPERRKPLWRGQRRHCACILD